MDLWVIQYCWLSGMTHEWSPWQAVYETTYVAQPLTKAVSDRPMSPRPLVDIIKRASELGNARTREDMQFRIRNIATEEVIPVEAFAGNVVDRTSDI